MSNTRHSESGHVAQERYMSSPEYVELRGIAGNAVTAKAALFENPACRSLLYFLQAMSLKPGGLQAFSDAFLTRFADRIGTPTMHRLGRCHGSPFSDENAEAIHDEVLTYDERHNSFIARRAAIARRQMEKEDADIARRLRRECSYSAADDEYYCETHDTSSIETVSQVKAIPAEQRTFDYFLARCQRRAGELPAFLVELCVNPALRFSAPGEPPKDSQASLPWFEDLIGALFEYRRLHDEAIRAAFAMTEVAEKVFATLDVALATGRMVLIEGDSGIGKTTATQNWCNLHLGEARFVSLSGVTHKTGVFRAIAKTLGLASSYARTSTEMQARIEDVLQRSRLVLVMDEAHHLFSGAERVYSRPELVDWINTSLFNQGVPTALVCTPQFRARLDRVEKQTGWNADQLRRRVKRLTRLPAIPRKEELAAVARKLLPEADVRTIKLIVGYSLFSKRHFSALSDVMDEARLIARRAGREAITFEDYDRAIKEFCAPTAEAWATPALATPRRSGRRVAVLDLPARISPDESPDLVSGRSGASPDLAGDQPAQDPASRRAGAALPQRFSGDAAAVA